MEISLWYLTMFLCFGMLGMWWTTILRPGLYTLHDYLVFVLLPVVWLLFIFISALSCSFILVFGGYRNRILFDKWLVFLLSAHKCVGIVLFFYLLAGSLKILWRNIFKIYLRSRHWDVEQSNFAVDMDPDLDWSFFRFWVWHESL